ncbi:archaeal ATPase [Thermococcus kodakarensis KOD1]|uniref:Archaeal ATPase n=1 Tax=Thermococcus kodakarensis (strain ATCC BAA-918 / JCM 12380 / KOD1) TaxID=69014 RepID=Q5JHP0_THEKO|nr:ATP-binding protein [Thermococcus kodakarensis]WCN28054.1 ATP-binding protein [Thermococcus kodakarensis]WCN30351.1 ATP-binding protein [Thermococcus kodakarensis]BAD86409.1 archaeal ATPase [Thermococcus kodakarensis KOD1]
MLSREELIEVLAPYNFWGREQDTGITRGDYLKDIRRKLSTGNALALVGVRRAGKTTLARQYLRFLIEKGLPPEETLYVNLEEPRFYPDLSLELLEEIFSAFKTYISRGARPVVVLDEVQNVEGWERWVRKVLDLGEAEVIVTGSSSSLLRSELATLLTGRVLVTEVYPLSFREFLSFKGLPIELPALLGRRGEVERALREYLEFGGFPQVVLTDDEGLKRELLRELFEGIILRDVAYRHGFRDARLVKLVAELALSRFSSLVSASRLRNEVSGIVGRKVSPNLVDSVLDAMEEAYLIHRVPILSPKVKDVRRYPKKLYAVDTGLANVMITRFTENIGRLAENAVARHLVQRHGRENVFYYRNGHEVDFVVRENLKISRLVQVSWDVDESWEREVEGLVEAAKHFGLSEGILVTGWKSCEERVKGINVRCLPLWRFLLS